MLFKPNTLWVKLAIPMISVSCRYWLKILSVLHKDVLWTEILASCQNEQIKNQSRLLHPQEVQETALETELLFGRENVH